MEGDRRGARVGDRRHLPRERRGAHRPDRRDRPRDRPRAADLRGAAAASSRCGCSSTSAPSATSATSPLPTCSRSRRCGSGCARTPSSASRWAARIDRQPPRGPRVPGRRAQDSRGGGDPLARVVFVAPGARLLRRLLPVTQRLKHTPTAVQQFNLIPYFSPTPVGPRHKQEAISFKLAQRRTGDGDDHRLSAATSSRRSCTTSPVARYKRSRCAGTAVAALRAATSCGQDRQRASRSSCPRTRAGSPPPGEYRVRRQPARTSASPVLSPRSFTLVAPMSVPRRRPGEQPAARRDDRWRRCRGVARVVAALAVADAHAAPRRSRCWRSSRCRSGCRSPPTGATVNLLIPLYLVVAAGTLAHLLPRLISA